MRVFRPTRRDAKTGKSVAYKLWYIELRDHNEIIRRLPSFSDKRQSEAAGRNLETLAAGKINGDALDKQLSRWVESLPKAMRDALCRIGLLDSSSAVAGKPLSEHLADFRAALMAKNGTAKYADLTLARVQALFDGCGCRLWNDIHGHTVEAWLADEREAGRLSASKPAR